MTAIDRAFLVMALNEGEKEDRRRRAAEHPGGGRNFHTFRQRGMGEAMKVDRTIDPANDPINDRANGLIRRIARRVSAGRAARDASGVTHASRKPAFRHTARGFRSGSVVLRLRLRAFLLRWRLRDVAARFLVLRDERIEPVLRETRAVVACKGRCGRCSKRGSRDEDDRGERRSFHDSPRN